MPRTAPRVCSRCQRKVRGVCDCRPAWRTDEELDRGTTTERGYGADWQKFRSWYLAENPLCEDCTRAATEVHHVVKIKINRSLRLRADNVMSLCQPCHAARTARGE